MSNNNEELIKALIEADNALQRAINTFRIQATQSNHVVVINPSDLDVTNPNLLKILPGSIVRGGIPDLNDMENRAKGSMQGHTGASLIRDIIKYLKSK